jgi:hypothetical protein
MKALGWPGKLLLLRPLEVPTRRARLRLPRGLGIWNTEFSDGFSASSPCTLVELRRHTLPFLESTRTL